MAFSNFRDWRPGVSAPGFAFFGLSPLRARVLGDLTVGCRLIYRSKTEWRDAVVSRKGPASATLTVHSPSGRTYRLRRLLSSEVSNDGGILFLKYEKGDEWRENFAVYDPRW